MTPTGPSSWKKCGLVYVPPGSGHLRSHAMLPTPLVLEDRIRVFFASCDESLRGRVYFVDLDREHPQRVISAAVNPALDLGPPGSFDEHGVNPSQVIVRDKKLFLYYIGWKRVSEQVPYTLFAGLAISRDGGNSFQRYGDGQILLPTGEQTLFRTAPFVFPERAGWGMLYIGGGQFFDGMGGKKLPTYSLYRTYSADGYNWDQECSSPLISPDVGRGEIGFGRPVLWQNGNQPMLMISVRTQQGYTLRELSLVSDQLSSHDVLSSRKEQWESEMTCFGSVCTVTSRELLFYNGNGFGRSGFGLAVRETSREPIQQLYTVFLDRLQVMKGWGLG